RPAPAGRWPRQFGGVARGPQPHQLQHPLVFPMRMSYLELDHTLPGLSDPVNLAELHDRETSTSHVEGDWSLLSRVFLTTEHGPLAPSGYQTPLVPGGLGPGFRAAGPREGGRTLRAEGRE